MSKYVLDDLIGKYYPTLETIVNDLAAKSTGGEKAKVVFPSGTVIIKLK